MELAPTRIGGKYEILRELGSGGFATVYLAREVATELGAERLVAIKVLRDDGSVSDARQRFSQEIRVMGNLRHPHIVPLFDSGIWDGRPYLVMPYIEGESLAARIRREGKLPVDVVVKMGIQMCEALECAHKQHLVHRDVKPSNILFDPAGNAWLSDFGVARWTELTGDERQTRSSAGAPGTLAYASPEQIAGDRHLDGRSDVYSLGVVLYEATAGSLPFEVTGRESLVRRVAGVAPELQQQVPGVPLWYSRLVAEVLSPVPTSRPSAAELGTALVRRASEAPRDRAPWRTARRGPVYVALSVLVGAAALITVTWPSRGNRPDRYVVFPFRHVGGPPPSALGGANPSFLTHEALAPLKDVLLVNRARLESALAADSGSLDFERLQRIARRLDADYFIWGEVASRSDSTFVRAFLHASEAPEDEGGGVAAFGVSHVELGASALSAESLFLRFVGMTRKLVLRSASTDSAPSLGTDYIEALSWKVGADSARQAWRLDLARERYARAIAIDSRYAPAQLGLAQIGSWMDEPVASWRPHAAAAVRELGRGPSREGKLARALLALADSAYEEACRVYDELLLADSTDSDAWFGRGECLTRDPVVIPDAQSPSGYLFRGDFHSGAEAYSVALTLTPLSHRADGAAVVRRLGRVLRTSQWLRSGVRDGGEARYLAWPEMRGDTVAFIPFPWEQFTGNRPPPRPQSLSAVLARNRMQLDLRTAEWVRSFPRSAEAWSARAEFLEGEGRLEGAGEPGALEAIRRARNLASLDPVPLVIREVRVLLRLGQAKPLKRLADSIVAAPSSAPYQESLAAIAILIGDVEGARKQLDNGAPRTFFALDGEQLRLPVSVTRRAHELLLEATMGSDAAALARAEVGVIESVARELPASDRERVTIALLYEPALFGFPVHRLRLAHTHRLAPTQLQRQRLVWMGDAGGREALLRMVSDLEGRAAREVPIETAYVAAAELLIVGDTTRARTLLRRSVGDREQLPASVLATVASAGALRRAAALLAAIGTREDADTDALLTTLRKGQ